jgi:hypothetical protein
MFRVAVAPSAMAAAFDLLYLTGKYVTAAMTMIFR